ncbi:MAG TPA: septum formation initiator family protein [Terriglobia bacterium]|nr:septum formation initiator family protein [Terriglobia bacterium]
MATVAVSFPSSKRRPRNQPVAGRAPYPEIYFVKHIDNSRLQREVDHEKRRECFGLLVLGTLAFLFIMLFAWQHFECVRYGYLIQQLKQEQAEKVERNHALKVQFASLSDPQRIDTLARSELGLAPPKPNQIVQIGSPAQVNSKPGATEFARNIENQIGISTGR